MISVPTNSVVLGKETIVTLLPMMSTLILLMAILLANAEVQVTQSPLPTCVKLVMLAVALFRHAFPIETARPVMLTVTTLSPGMLFIPTVKVPDSLVLAVLAGKLPLVSWAYLVHPAMSVVLRVLFAVGITVAGVRVTSIVLVLFLFLKTNPLTAAVLEGERTFLNAAVALLIASATLKAR